VIGRLVVEVDEHKAAVYLRELYARFGERPSEPSMVKEMEEYLRDLLDEAREATFFTGGFGSACTFSIEVER
jgi:hypothetical protein